MEIKRTFISGVMNKDLDDRLVPDGSYRDALNITVGTSTTENQGTVSNIPGNTEKLDIEDVLIANGFTPPPGDIRCIGSFTHTVNNEIYWFLTSAEYDMIIRYREDELGVVSSDLLLIDVRPSGVIKFNSEYLITGVNIIGDLLFWTDDLNPPRKININRRYRQPDITNDTVSVIVKPPLNPPTIQLVNTTGTENNIKDKVIRFAYRFKYNDNEYSALSPFSEIAFQSKAFGVDLGTGQNVSMQNLYNAVDITVATGGSNVSEIQLIFKDSQNLNANIIENIKKSEAKGAATYTYRFSNNKVYSVLDNKQITRLFDNVPLKAKAQEIIGNRLAYGNYVQFYDIKTCAGEDIIVDYGVSLRSSAANINGVQTFKSGRDYELGIVYLDDYGRMTPVITSKTNTVNIPISSSINKNELYVNVNSVAPCFAKHYRFFLKQNRELYYNIIPTAVYNDGLFVYFQLSNYDVNKAKPGDYLYIKSTYNGPTNNSGKFKVIEVAAKGKDFLERAGTTQLAGTYLKLKVDDGSIIFGQNTAYNYKSKGVGYSGKRFSGAINPLSSYTPYTESIIPYGAKYGATIPAYLYCNTIKDRRFVVEFVSGNTIRYRDFLSSQWTGPIQVNSESLTYGGNTYSGNYINDYDNSKLTFVSFSNSINNIPGTSYRVNMRGSGKTIFGCDLKFVTPDQRDGGFAAVPVNSEFSGARIRPGSSIRIKISESEGYNDQPEQIFTSSSSYDNIEEWFFEEGIYSQFKQFNDTGVNKGSHTVFFRACEYVEQKDNGIVGKVAQNNPRWSDVRMFIKGWHVKDDWNIFTGTNDTVRNQVTLEFDMFIPDALTILETEGEQTYSDIFYEMPGTYPVVNSRHTSTYSGDVNQTGNSPATIKVRGFNAFSFGNGMESSVINDDFAGAYFSVPPRASSYTENYSQIRAESSICYSGTYAQNTNTNNLNEFNLSTANFKVLDRMYGPIQKLYSRNNDIVVFQEDKVSKVMYEKNLLYDSTGGGSVASIPEVLGSFVPYTGEYGMSNNPESFARWGNDVFFTDVKRGSVLKFSESGIEDISSTGMKSWFRDSFESDPLTQKIGCFDTHTFQYVLTANDRRAVACMFNISKTSVSFDGPSKTNQFVFRVESNTSWTLQLVNTGSGTSWATLSTYSGYGTKDVYITLTSNTGSELPRGLTMRAIGCGATKNIPLTQSNKKEIEKVIVVVGDNSNDSSKQTIQENGWTSDGGDPYYKDDTNILYDAAFYNAGTGLVGTGAIPNVSDTVNVYGLLNTTNTQSDAVKPFNPNLGNKLYYLDSNSVYDQSTYEDLLDDATEITPTLSGGKYVANFTYNANGSNLYIIWDYRNRVASNGTGSSPSAGTTVPENVTILNANLIGSYSINYTGTGVNRFQLYDSNGALIYDTLYVGLNSTANYNALKALGIDDSEIALSKPYNGLVNNGTGSFSVSKTDYGNHLLKAYSPISGNNWSFSLSNPALTSVTISNLGYESPALACASSTTRTVYATNSNLTIATIYADSLGEALFDGANSYFKSGTFTYLISATGIASQKQSCVCGESTAPVINQSDVNVNVGSEVLFKISATNNPLSYAIASTCHTFSLTGGLTGAVFGGQKCDGNYASIYVNANETIEYGFENGSVSKLVGDSGATFTSLGPCAECVLPPGMKFDPLSGTISGTPLLKGSYPIPITATNCVGVSSTSSFNIFVSNGQVELTKFGMDIDDPQAGSNAACFLLTPSYTDMYTNGLLAYPVIRDAVFSDSQGTAPFNGNNQWYLMNNLQAIKIDADGYVTDIFTCAVIPTPSAGNVQLAFGSTSSAACSNTTFTTYYYTDAFGSTGSLYTNSGATTLAPSGWYKRDIGGGLFASFQWNGTAWVGAVDCPL